MAFDTGTVVYLLAGCFALGMLHGVIPDEHTWPITFAYSVGTTTGKGGIKSGAWFSLAFTAQRALMSMIVYLALAALLGAWGINLATADQSVNGPVYIVVGAAMALAGFLILTDRIHYHPFRRYEEKEAQELADPKSSARTGEGSAIPVHWCIIHGFISGFGTDGGILSTWIYVLTLPYLASYGLWYLAPTPGLLFGLGTFLVLMFIGYFFGQTLQIAKRVGPNRIANFGRLVGARTLLLGGIAFMIFGPLYWSGWYSAATSFDAGTLIVIIVLVALAVPVMIYTWREVQKLPRDFPSSAPAALHP
ncbi:MAG: hypothetical protein ACREB9_05270 [Thermoplasmata archaeon]